MFERFTTSARVTVVLAQEEARRLGHREIGSAHLLLGLLRPSTLTTDDADVAEVLRNHGLTPEDVERETRTLADRGPRTDLDDAQVLSALGIDVARIREAVEANFGPGALDLPLEADLHRQRGLLARLLRRRGRPGGSRAPGPVNGHIPFTSDAKKSLELSLREAIRLQDRSIGATHLLLGLLRADGDATTVLTRLGVDPAALQAELEQRRRRSA